jgi:hypothetical protein
MDVRNLTKSAIKIVKTQGPKAAAAGVIVVLSVYLYKSQKKQGGVNKNSTT